MRSLCTIGFAGKNLEQFVRLLREAQVTGLIDIRLRPTGQLSRYAHQADLKYVLEHYEGIEYVHAAELAPTGNILDDYRKSKDWNVYVRRFTSLMDERDMCSLLHSLAGDRQSVVLLCSEATAEQCHRRLLAEAYTKKHPETVLRHL